MKVWGITSLLFSTLILGACAKELPVETIPDPNNEKLSKAHFLSDKNWFYKVTVTKTSSNTGFAFVGFQSDMKAGKFKFSEDRLQFVNSVTPYPHQTAADPELLISWNVTHHDTRLAESGGKVTNREEENNTIAWNQKNYFKVDWEKAIIREGTSFPYTIDLAFLYDCWNRADSRLVDKEIGADAISLTVAVDYVQLPICSGIRRGNRGDFTYTVHYKYSFRKMNEKDMAYKPYVYDGEDDPLINKYGYFKTVREIINPQTGLFKNIHFMNRWKPDSTVVYYFAPGTPEKYKWIFNDPKIGIFARTNQLMKRNGLKTRFEIRENDGSKKFGDLRYSFIKFTEEIDGAAPLGYGPSDANPFTGEIVSGNLMIWTGYMKYYLKRIKEQVEPDGNRTPFEKSTIQREMQEFLQSPIEQWTSTAKDLAAATTSGKAFDFLLPKVTYGYPGWARFTQKNYPGASANKLTLSPNADLFKARDHGQVEKLMGLNAQNSMKDFKVANEGAHRHLSSLEMGHERNTVIYGIDNTLGDIRKMVIDGATDKEIIDTVLYRVSIHEFGHNLNLRHNFYGSVDKKNFRDPIKKVVLDKDGNPKLDETGQPLIREIAQTTSSVMEYLSLVDEMHLDYEWEPYDEAALVYAYSDGAKDLSVENNTQYLFCTDEDRVLNAMCNVWDHGSTPTEIVMSLIETYEQSYYVRNWRYDRAYWDTGGYASSIFGVMFSMKKFLMLWRTGFTNATMQDQLSRNGLKKTEIKNSMADINADLVQAVKLTIAFYNSVLQQTSSDRPYQSRYNEVTWELEQMGIIYDKIFAMRFLVGDEGFMYNPNSVLGYASFLTYKTEPELDNLLEKVMQNLVTQRLAMEPWFIDYGRALYALNSRNPYNVRNEELVSKIRVSCYTPETFQTNFGIDPARYVKSEGDAPRELQFGLINLQTDPNIKGRGVVDPYYSQQSGTLGAVLIEGNYYLTSSFHNPYSYKIIENLVQQPGRFEDSLGVAKSDVNRVFMNYHWVKEMTPECL